MPVIDRPFTNGPKMAWCPLALPLLWLRSAKVRSKLIRLFMLARIIKGAASGKSFTIDRTLLPHPLGCDLSGALSAPSSFPMRKYFNVPTVQDGIRYDSKLEAQCALELDLLRRIGEILWFIRQVNFELEGGVRYRCDFLAMKPTGALVIDATGMMTQAKKNKLKQMKARYGITVMIYKRRGKACVLCPFDEIAPAA